MVKKSTKYAVLDYAARPDKDYDVNGDVVIFKGKKYWVNILLEIVEFIGNVN